MFARQYRNKSVNLSHSCCLDNSGCIVRSVLYTLVRQSELTFWLFRARLSNVDGQLGSNSRGHSSRCVAVLRQQHGHGASVVVVVASVISGQRRRWRLISMSSCSSWSPERRRFGRRWPFARVGCSRRIRSRAI